MAKLNSDKILLEIIKTSRMKRRSVSFALAKLLEEAGEFSQASLAKNGDISETKLKHKDQVFEEASDAIGMVVDVVVKVYWNDLESGKLTEKQLLTRILSQVPKKLKKWKKVEGITGKNG
jgi:NTP pyrophosphatase (non-canonical NTP hydrolase)